MMPKFRVWDKELSQMTYPVDGFATVYFCLGQDGTLYRNGNVWIYSLESFVSSLIVLTCWHRCANSSCDLCNGVINALEMK